MPIYEFECQKCKTHIEVYQRHSDKSPTKCRKCGGKLEKVISAPAIQFKGSGWYVTDYAQKATKGDKGESEPAGDSKKTDKKKESSPEKKTSDKTSTPKSSDD
ncbi:MAG TPA: FmdB family zinc ribbon protein [Pyrinomonadaceae bacterium]|nr:FmdB family zinc ribbon protein [Pyrinomonadaceae bacterium]